MFSVSENDFVIMFLAGVTVQLFTLSAAMWIVIITLRWKTNNTKENSIHDETACCCCCYDGGDATAAGGIVKKQRRGIETNKLITSITGNCCSSGCCDDDDDDDRTIETCDSMDSEDFSQTGEDEIIHGIDIV